MKGEFLLEITTTDEANGARQVDWQTEEFETWRQKFEEKKQLVRPIIYYNSSEHLGIPMFSLE